MEGSKVRTVEIPPASHAALSELLLAYKRAERDLQVAWSMCCRMNDLPDGTVMESLGPGVVTVRDG